MAIANTTIYEVRSTGNDLNGGGCTPCNANFMTDRAVSNAQGTGTGPAVTSASYTFVAGDVNAWLFIRSGTNWIPGWYQIASVAGGAATLNAAIGAAILLNSQA